MLISKRANWALPKPLVLAAGRCPCKPARGHRSWCVGLARVVRAERLPQLSQAVRYAVQSECFYVCDGVRMHRQEGVGEGVKNHLLAVIRDLNGHSLAEGRGIGEVRRSVVEIYGGRAGAVNDSEWSVINHLDRCRVCHEG